MKPKGFASSLYISSPRFALAGSDSFEILSRRLPGFHRIQANRNSSQVIFGLFFIFPLKILNPSSCLFRI